MPDIPGRRWYRDDDLGEFQHHILYLEKTDKCDMTFDCPADDTTHPEPTRDRFWYLYNDTDGRLFMRAEPAFAVHLSIKREETYTKAAEKYPSLLYVFLKPYALDCAKVAVDSLSSHRLI